MLPRSDKVGKGGGGGRGVEEDALACCVKDASGRDGFCMGA